MFFASSHGHANNEQVLYCGEVLAQEVLSLLLEFRTGVLELTLAAAMTTLSHILWPLAVLLIGLVEAHTLWSPSGSQTISEGKAQNRKYIKTAQLLTIFPY